MKCTGKARFIAPCDVYNAGLYITASIIEVTRNNGEWELWG
jgi:hypothetical protein